jgi:plastocyanin
MFLLGTVGFCTRWTITNSGLTFSPATITIIVGDDVSFQLESIHNAVEVSLATWNANQISPVIGFSTPFGGGLVAASSLPVGTHYFICQNHGPLGMKGTIIVQAATGISDNSSRTDIAIYPNPSGGKFVLDINSLQIEKNSTLEISSIKGEIIYQTRLTIPKSDIDLRKQPKGIYLLKIFNGQTILTKKIIIE